MIITFSERRCNLNITIGIILSRDISTAISKTDNSIFGFYNYATTRAASRIYANGIVYLPNVINRTSIGNTILGHLENV